MENANTTWADHIEKPPPKEQGEEQNQIRTLAIFGLERPWHAQSWQALDFGGSTIAHGATRGSLEYTSAAKKAVCFHGVINGTGSNSGFVSRTSPDGYRWDLNRSLYLRIGIARGDGKTYTISLIDKVSSRSSLQESVEWEHDFIGNEGYVDLPWNTFQPTLQGSRALDLSNVSGFRIGVRSIGWKSQIQQDGPFLLEIVGIADIIPELHTRV